MLACMSASMQMNMRVKVDEEVFAAFCPLRLQHLVGQVEELEYPRPSIGGLGMTTIVKLTGALALLGGVVVWKIVP